MAEQFKKSELLNTINLYFDNALNAEEVSGLMEKTKSNPYIANLFDQEKAFRIKIKDCCSRNAASDSLKNAVRNKIESV